MRAVGSMNMVAPDFNPGFGNPNKLRAVGSALVKMYFSSFSILNFSNRPKKMYFPILVYNRFPVFYVKYGCYVHLVIGVDHLSYFYVPILWISNQ